LIRRGAVLASFAVIALSAGCALVTDVGTTGFTLTDAGTGAGCQSVADCEGGAICCITSLSPVTSACEGTCPTVPLGVNLQFCATDTECGRSTCVEQVCAGSTVHACGLVSSCSAAGIPLEASAPIEAAAPPDASAPIDASFQD
jgi:hypothetical protein